MQFRFDFEKTVQAAGVLLHFDGQRMPYLRLLKLLYIAERELLAETGQPITGDRVVAMRFGPVLSRVYDLIRGQSPRAGDWDNFIHTDGYAVELQQEPGRGKLSKAEVEKLAEVSERYHRTDEFELSDCTHAFPEWTKHFSEGTSTPIPWQEILSAQGKRELVAAIEKDEGARQILDELFGD